MLSVFTLPFPLDGYDAGWMMSIFILFNVISVLAYISAYVQFRIKPPLPKFRIRNAWEFIKECTWCRSFIVYGTIVLDVVVFGFYFLYVSTRTIHLVFFEL